MVIPMKRNVSAGALAGFFIGLLSLPVSYNVGLGTLFGLSPIAIALILWAMTIVGIVIGIVLGKILPVLFQLSKFVVVGVLNTLVDFGVLNLLIAIFSVATGIGYAIFKSISFIVAVANSFAWNKYWTFESHKKTDYYEVLSFLAVSVVGFFINVISASVVVNFVPILFGLSSVVWANVGALTGTILAFTWNFLGYKLFVFKDKKPAPASHVTQ